MCWPSALAAVDDTNNRYLFKKETRLDVQWLFKRAAAIVNPVRSIMKIALLLLLIATVQLASSGVRPLTLRQILARWPEIISVFDSIANGAEIRRSAGNSFRESAIN